MEFAIKGQLRYAQARVNWPKTEGKEHKVSTEVQLHSGQ